MLLSSYLKAYIGCQQQPLQKQNKEGKKKKEKKSRLCSSLLTLNCISLKTCTAFLQEKVFLQRWTGQRTDGISALHLV